MKKVWRQLGALFSRAGLASRMGKTFGEKRDLWKTLGYRDNPDVDTYLSFYRRGDIAGRLIDLPADAAWQFNPEIRLTDATEGQTFLDEVKALDERVKLWSTLAQVDRISGIGRFGVVLIGFRTESALGLREPAQGMTSLKDVLFLKAFHEGQVDVKEWVEDENDPRFGLPEIYQIEMSRGDRQSAVTRDVHWTRILHVTPEVRIDDEVYGLPRLERVINKLDDLNKTLGASAEMFWLMVGGILHADLDPEVEVSPEDMEAFEEDIIEAMHGLRRLIQTRGVELSRVAAATTIDPQATYEAIKEVLSAASGIPERIIFGSERGELASSQDQRQWHSNTKSRQANHVEPNIVRAFFNHLVMVGALKDVPDFELHWPPLDEPTEAELAEIAKNKSDAAKNLAPGGQTDLLIKPWEAREMLGLPPIPEDAPEGAEEAFAEGLDLEDELDDELPPASDDEDEEEEDDAA